MLLAAPVLLGQDAPPPRNPGRFGGRPASTIQILAQLQAQEGALNELAASLKRDAFLSGQVIAATNDLNDFQKNAAIQKAIDRITKAMLRAGEKPVAPPNIMQLLADVKLTLEHARDQGSMTDLEALKREILKSNSTLRWTVFRELATVRSERQALAEIEMRASRITNQLDDAVGEALESVFPQ